MSAWILVVLFVHQDGVHSLQVPFVTQPACEQAAAQWRTDRNTWRIREVIAKCHKTE